MIRTRDLLEKVADEFYVKARRGTLARRIRKLQKKLVALDGEVLLELPEQWLFRLDPDAVGATQGWCIPSADLSAFRPISTHSTWEGQLGTAYDGYAWYVVDVVIPETTAKHVWLLFGAVDETWKLWIDGQYVGASTGHRDDIWDQPAAIEMTGRYTPGKKTRIAVRVHDYMAAGGIWKPVKITTTEEGQQADPPVDQIGEDPLLPGM